MARNDLDNSRSGVAVGVLVFLLLKIKGSMLLRTEDCELKTGDLP